MMVCVCVGGGGGVLDVLIDLVILESVKCNALLVKTRIVRGYVSP